MKEFFINFIANIMNKLGCTNFKDLVDNFDMLSRVDKIGVMVCLIGIPIIILLLCLVIIDVSNEIKETIREHVECKKHPWKAMSKSDKELFANAFRAFVEDLLPDDEFDDHENLASSMKHN